MLKASDLFHKCAYDIKYDTLIGENHVVNYKFLVNSSTLYIYFQGSNSKEDWVDNFRFWPRVKHFFKFLFTKKRKAYDNAPLKYHTGFLDCYELIRPLIVKKITEKNTRGDFKYKDIVVVGYSHGAALAGLCYETCSWVRGCLVTTGYCFEAPRWLYKCDKGNKYRWKNCKVYRNHTDIVTHVPPKLFGYMDACDIVHIGKKKHYGPIKSHFPDKVYESLLEYEAKE